MWVIKRTDEYERRFKLYQKKHPRELTAVLDNLDTFHQALNSGVKPRQARFGFIHVEPSDVLAIDQKGGGAKLAQTRLYVYPDAESEVLYLLTLGDKRSQHQDIENCRHFVEQIREWAEEGEGNAHGQETDRDREDDAHERPTDGPSDLGG
jgi:hypothetical protein